MALNSQVFSVPYYLTARVERGLEGWRAGNGLARLWSGDASLWTGAGEERWLGWLRAPAQAEPSRYIEVAADVRTAGFSDVLLLGMGGSVLGPAVFAQVFGHRRPFPRLRVLDSVDPSQIRQLESSLRLERTLVIVSSKSGTTLESRVLLDYFIERLREAVGPAMCGRHFVAITDPGTALEQMARDLGFRDVCLGRPDVGGRFSAFSDFGLIPLAAMGVDVGNFLEQTVPMVEACGPKANPLSSPGVLLGVTLAVLARAGHDKLSFLVAPSVRDLGLWLEQLLAESTGKRGLGIIPVAGGELRHPDEYGSDRTFVSIALENEEDEDRQTGIMALEEHGHPLVRIGIQDPMSIGQELFRWEIATSVAGSELGVNPFDQPDVEASKVITRGLMEEYEAKGTLPSGTPVFEDDGLSLFAEGSAAAELWEGARPDWVLDDWLDAFLGSVGVGDYVALLAYAPMEDRANAALGMLRAKLARNGKTAVTLGFGPRYLHSSGQLHKGGPNTGVFIILVSEDSEDLDIPGRAYTFGIVKAAQARADARALGQAGRRVIRFDVRGDFASGIRRVTDSTPIGFAV